MTGDAGLPGLPGALVDGRRGIEPDRLRAALAAVRSPVAVVTSYLDGRPYGATVSAFSSLSSVPPLVLTAVQAKSELLTQLRDAGTYGINVLADGQHELARAFAGPGGDPFSEAAWVLEEGVPRLDGTASWVRCRLEDLLPGGDSVIAVGHVVHAEAGGPDPLLHSGTFPMTAGRPSA